MFAKLTLWHCSCSRSCLNRRWAAAVRQQSGWVDYVELLSGTQKESRYRKDSCMSLPSTILITPTPPAPSSSLPFTPFPLTCMVCPWYKPCSLGVSYGEVLLHLVLVVMVIKYILSLLLLVISILFTFSPAYTEEETYHFFPSNATLIFQENCVTSSGLNISWINRQDR